MTQLVRHLGDHQESLQDDVWSLRLSLVAVVEKCHEVELQTDDWKKLGAPAHWPGYLIASRLDVLQEALTNLAIAALDARLVAECVKTRVFEEEEQPR